MSNTCNMCDNQEKKRSHTGFCEAWSSELPKLPRRVYIMSEMDKGIYKEIYEYEYENDKPPL